MARKKQNIEEKDSITCVINKDFPAPSGPTTINGSLFSNQILSVSKLH